MPVFVSIIAPGGATNNEYVSGLGGKSGSVAVLVKENKLPTMAIWLGMFVNTNAGGRFDSSTMIVKLFVMMNAPFDTLTKIELLDGPCASVGVQLMTPL